MRENEFIAIVNRNNQRLYLIALSYTKNSTDTEDIMQNVFMKLRNLYDKRNTDFSVFLYFYDCIIFLYKLNDAHFCCVTTTRACFDNTAVTTVSVFILWSNFIKKLFNYIFLSYISKNLSS